MMERQLIGLKKGNGGFSGSWAVLYLALILAVVAMNGCSSCDEDCDDALPVYVLEITSDIDADGDIGVTPDGDYTIASASDTGSVLAGVDPASGEEFRGFLNFPLRGIDGVPFNAVIESATLELFIRGTGVASQDPTLPFLIDLVDFQPPFLIADDFDRVSQPSLLTMPVDFYSSDVGSFVVIDVTALMDEAQAEGLPDLQLRFVLDFSEDTGLIEIEDDDIETAPLLTVTYF